MGRWVSASPVHTVVKRQALPIAHLLIPEKFGCEIECEEIEISVKLEKQTREQVCINVGHSCIIHPPPCPKPPVRRDSSWYWTWPHCCRLQRWVSYGNAKRASLSHSSIYSISAHGPRVVLEVQKVGACCIR